MSCFSAAECLTHVEQQVSGLVAACLHLWMPVVLLGLSAAAMLPVQHSRCMSWYVQHTWHEGDLNETTNPRCMASMQLLCWTSEIVVACIMPPDCMLAPHHTTQLQTPSTPACSVDKCPMD